MNPRHLERGQEAEALALATLQAAGLTLHTRNYRCAQGELDLVMQAPDGALVVVEVRYRRTETHGGAAETVGASKQRKVILAAQHLLQARPELRRKPLRFDVVAVSGAEGPGAVEWIQDAFQAG
ncbi:MAG TPA: YraN family protein [Gammaproteobacteria bacterium]|nr:YraN family protein [Gammaproteobacteria bacterium]